MKVMGYGKFTKGLVVLFPVWGLLAMLLVIYSVGVYTTICYSQEILAGKEVTVAVQQDKRLWVWQGFGYELMTRNGKVVARHSICARGQPLIIFYLKASPDQLAVYRKFFPVS